MARLTGLTTPVFGVSWNPPESHIQVARRIITFLEDRRVLYAPSEIDVPDHCLRSIVEIRGFLTIELQGLRADADLADSLRALRAACGKFMNTVGVRPDIVRYGTYTGQWASWEFNGALGELRGVFGVHIARLAAAYGLDVENGLSAILPAEGDLDKPTLADEPATHQIRPASLGKAHYGTTVDNDRLALMAVHELTSLLCQLRDIASYSRSAEGRGVSKAEATLIESVAVRGLRYLDNLRILKRQRGPTEIRRQAASDLAGVIRRVVDGFAYDATAKGLELRCDLHGHGIRSMYRVDSRLFTIALANVIDNALKYSRFESVVRVNLDLPNDGSILLKVFNNSAIPPPTDGDFALGRRGEAAAMCPAGLGIGLWTANAVVRWHLGTLTIGVEPGGITVVSMHIPSTLKNEGVT